MRTKGQQRAPRATRADVLLEDEEEDDDEEAVKEEKGAAGPVGEHGPAAGLHDALSSLLPMAREAMVAAATDRKRRRPRPLGSASAAPDITITQHLQGIIAAEAHAAGAEGQQVQGGAGVGGAGGGGGTAAGGGGGEGVPSLVDRAAFILQRKRDALNCYLRTCCMRLSEEIVMGLPCGPPAPP